MDGYAFKPALLVYRPDEEKALEDEIKQVSGVIQRTFMHLPISPMSRYGFSVAEGFNPTPHQAS